MPVAIVARACGMAYLFTVVVAKVSSIVSMMVSVGISSGSSMVGS